MFVYPTKVNRKILIERIFQIDNFYLPIDGFLSASILIYYDNRKQSNVFRNNKNIPNCR